jgi:hypothetical protein
MLRCPVSLLLKLRFASVSSFTIATAESVRLTNFHIHLVRGDRKSFSCISSSALLVHSVFPTVLLPSTSEKFQLHHVFCLACSFCVPHSTPSFDRLTMLRCPVSLLLKLRFASVSSFTIATAESVRLTNFPHFQTFVVVVVIVVVVV